MSKKPKISVITVTYNAARFIERTMKSVAEQTYLNIEHIVIDGQSKDGTLDIVNRLKTSNCFVLSEPDSGLYYAMNKGICNSTGDYIIFMNAGDVFYDSSTIAQVFGKMDTIYEFIYGDTVVVDENGNQHPYHKKSPLDTEISKYSFLNGMTICHQSMFVKKEKALSFQTDKYRLSNDIDWSIRVVDLCHTFRYFPIPIAKFLDGGVSQTNKLEAWKERFLILRTHFGLWLTIGSHFKIVFSFFRSKLR